MLLSLFMHSLAKLHIKHNRAMNKRTFLPSILKHGLFRLGILSFVNTKLSIRTNTRFPIRSKLEDRFLNGASHDTSIPLF